MDETIIKLLESVSDIPLPVGGGIAIGVISVAYLAYHTVSARKIKKQIAKENANNDLEQTANMADITMETKVFGAYNDSEDISNKSGNIELDSFKDLDQSSKTLFKQDALLDSTNPVSHELDQQKHNIPVLESDLSEGEFVLPQVTQDPKVESELDSNRNSNLNVNPNHIETTNSSAGIQFTESEQLEPLPSPIIVVYDKPVEVYNEMPKITATNLDITDNQHNPQEASEVNKNMSDDLLNFAIEQDLYGNKKDAVTYLNQAISAEEHLAEKIRLKTILREFENTDKKLQLVVESLPTIKQIEQQVKKIQAVRYIDPNKAKFVDLGEDDSINSVSDISSDSNTNDLKLNTAHKSDLIAPITDNFEATQATEVELPEIAISDSDFNSDLELNDSNLPDVDNDDLIQDQHIPGSIEVIKSNHSPSPEEINEMVKAHLELLPNLDSVSFDNVDIEHNPNDIDHVASFMENLSDAIEQDNARSTKNAQDAMDQDILDSVFGEVEEPKESNFSREHSNVNLELVDKSSDNQINLESPIANNINDKDQKLSSYQVWVNFMVMDSDKTFVDNKKFALSEEWGSLEASMSLNQQMNDLIQQNYSPLAKYAITLVLPIKL